MPFDVSPYLEDLEQRIDPAVETQLLEDWKVFASQRFTGDLFSPRRLEPKPPNISWPKPTLNAALADPKLMLIRELRQCSDHLAGASGRLLAARANYGTSILPSLFGVKLFWMSEESDTLPTSWPLGGSEAVQKVLEKGPPDINGGLGRRVLEMGQYFLQVFAPYPNISRYITLYHPDLQGPLDVCEVLWGSSLLLDLYENPDLVTALLELVTQIYERFMRAWLHLVPSKNEYAVHWGMLHRGNIMLRSDSAMNVSTEMYQQFSAPYDQRLLEAFSGGALHFCGKGDHYITQVSSLPGLNAINLSQPEYNDMEIIYCNTIDRGVALLDLSRETAMEALASGRLLHGLIHCN
jgi:hypothetical protein